MYDFPTILEHRYDLGILPITGITLPFLSYGGSSLLSYMIAIGMCFDIHRQTSIAKYNQID